MQSRGNNAVLHHFTKTIHAHGHIAQMRNALSQIIGERGYRLFLGSRIFTGRTTLGEKLRGVRFPRSPSELGANTPVRHADYLSAIEYTAGLLLPDVRRLREFEHFRGEASSVSCDSDAVDGDSDAEAISLARAQEQLQAAESLFGFSLWLSAEWMRLDEPGSERLVARASALLEQSKNPVIQLAVRFLYARRNGVYAAKQTAEVIHSYDIPEALKRFLLGVAHPAPFFVTVHG